MTSPFPFVSTFGGIKFRPFVMLILCLGWAAIAVKLQVSSSVGEDSSEPDFVEFLNIIRHVLSSEFQNFLCKAQVELQLWNLALHQNDEERVEGQHHALSCRSAVGGQRDMLLIVLSTTASVYMFWKLQICEKKD